MLTQQPLGQSLAKLTKRYDYLHVWFLVVCLFCAKDACLGLKIVRIIEEESLVNTTFICKM